MGLLEPTGRRDGNGREARTGREVSMNQGRRPASLQGVPMRGDLPEIRGRTVLVRTDFNVPLEEREGRLVVADDFRLRAALPTLEWLQSRGATVRVCSHLGRPHGAADARWAMAPVRDRLAVLCPGVELLENLRFDPGEEANDPHFVERLVEGCDAYVNEAFGVSHRAHASIVGPPRTLPSAAGLRLAEEVQVIGGLLEDPARPFVAAVGGAMAFTFLYAMGYDVGSSIVDVERVEECRSLLQLGAEILLPTDVVALEPGGLLDRVPSGLHPVADTKVVASRALPDGWQGLDIGPETAEAFARAVSQAGTVFWNGPVGKFEDERFAGGTRRVAEAVAGCQGFTVVGGGDSTSALDHFGLADRVDFVSTGGGASLVLIERGDLPGLAALRAAPNAPSR